MNSIPPRSLRDIKKGEIALIAINFALLVVTIVIAKIYYGQLQEMRKATEASTRATNIAAEALKSSNDSFQKTFTQMQAQTKEAARLADTSSDSAKAARNFYELDQRPWIGVTDYTCDCTEANGTLKINKLTLSYSNSGKTPAIKLSGQFIFVTRKWSEPIPSFDEEDERRRRAFLDTMKKTPSELRRAIEKDIKQMSGRLYPEGGALAPNAVNVRILGAGNMFGRDPSINLRGTERQIVYALGKITYYDTFSSQKHATTFCLSEDAMDHPSTVFSFCAKGQNMD